MSPSPGISFVSCVRRLFNPSHTRPTELPSPPHPPPADMCPCMNAHVRLMSSSWRSSCVWQPLTHGNREVMPNPTRIIYKPLHTRHGTTTLYIPLVLHTVARMYISINGHHPATCAKTHHKGDTKKPTCNPCMHSPILQISHADTQSQSCLGPNQLSAISFH